MKKGRTSEMRYSNNNEAPAHAAAAAQEPYLPTLMARVDAEFHADESPEEWNVRIRRNIRLNYQKDCLTPDQRNLFRQWEANVLNLRQNVHRLDLFEAAPVAALYIVGV